MDYKALGGLPQMFFQQAERLGREPFLWAKRDGAWHPLSWAEVADRVESLARGLVALGLEPGDRVALVSENRPEWLIADIAIMAAGGVTVPAYTTNTVSDHLHILTDIGARIAIVSTPALAKRLLPAAVQSPKAETVIAMQPVDDAPAQGLRVIGWDAALAMQGDFAPRMAAVTRTDTACIIYTSGTSGKPKGVMLSHGAVLSNAEGCHDFLRKLRGFEAHQSFLSFLPLSHSFEHTAGQMIPIGIGAEIYYAEGIDKLAANISEVRPTIICAVPRLYETMRDRILRGVERAGGLQEKLFRKTLELGRHSYEEPGAMGLGNRLLNALLDLLVRRKVRNRFGGRLKAFVSGGAPLNYEVGLFFQSLGLTILQGYGQTESSPVVSCNVPHSNKLHTVGPALSNVTVRIAEDGEILVQGELVMQGYWNLPQDTAATIVDGWLHTGDIGRIDEDGYIQITDRKKDIIVNSGGDNLSPARVEGMLTLEPEIEQAVVYGDKRPHLVGLLVPSETFAQEWAAANGKPADLAALAADPQFTAALSAAVDRVNKHLSAIERVRRFTVSPERFSVDNELMTPTMKLRRHAIYARHGETLKRLYGD